MRASRSQAGPPQAPPKRKPKVRAAPKTDSRPRLAPLYRVLIHNDAVTPMDFVIQVLRAEFRKDHAAALRIMLEAHFRGVALVAVLPLEEAEFRVERAHARARGAKFPLTFSFEAVECPP